MSRSIVGALAVALFVVVVSAEAQSGDGSLRGYVKDDQGAVPPGTTFTVDVQMKVWTLAETIAVTGDSPMIETGRPTSVLNIDGDPRITGGQDGVRYASKLIGKLNYLANGLASQFEGLRSRIASGFNDQLKKQESAHHRGAAIEVGGT